MNFTKDFTWDFTKDFFTGFDYCWIIKFLSRNSKLITENFGGVGGGEGGGTFAIFKQKLETKN